ncbi:MAG: glycosyltransferase family 2 protein [Muricomes sp.]|uniref:glycosyltransferase family 2 protein n=1 Tax=Faecalicatena contorta TaxID=39482 RepID=UPI002EAA62F9|nr:glycosyltransferase family 2 protein [Muricomes sp.]
MNSELLYSVVIPCYKSDHTLHKVISLTIDEFEKLNITRYEFILVNDCSPDDGKTWEKIKELAKEYDCVKGLNLARNFGQHNAIIAGLNYAKGDVFISMDDDLQTHPSQLPLLLKEFNEDYDVVYGYYPDKKHTLFRRLGTWFNNWSAEKLLGKPKDIHCTSFWVARKYVRDRIISFHGADPYLLGIILKTTRNIKSVPVKHFEREYGNSGYTLKKLIGLYSNYIGFSILPLRIARYLGCLLSCLALIGGITVFIRKLMLPHMSAGWPSLMIVILLSLGIQLLFLGIIGEYIGRSYLRLNGEPQYIIRDVINIEEEL